VPTGYGVQNLVTALVTCAVTVMQQPGRANHLPPKLAVNTVLKSYISTCQLGSGTGPVPIGWRSTLDSPGSP